MKLFTTIIMMVLLPLFTNAQTKSATELLKVFDSIAPNLLRANKVPGFAIAVIENGKDVIKKGYGFADITSQKEVSTKTGFNIGSISKMFTAWGIMKLVEDGKIKLDAPVSNYIRRWKLPNSEFDANKVTLRNILMHTAGLSVHGYNGYESKEKLPSLTDCLMGTYNADEKVAIVMEPESKWTYSGGGYTILQLLIEEVSGKTYADFMHATIFKPLKMKHTSFDIGKRIIQESAKAYDENGVEIKLRQFTAQAAAGLHTTIDDLILFAKASFSKNPVLSKSSIEQLITPTDLSKGDYGMGYMIMNRFGDFTLSGHGGSNEGWHSAFLLDFESKSGIIMLTNGSNGRNILFKSIVDWANWHSEN